MLPEPTSNLQRFPMLPLQMSILAGHSFIMHIYRKRYFNILILLSNNPVVIRHPKNHRCAKIITNDQNLHPQAPPCYRSDDQMVSDNCINFLITGLVSINHHFDRCCDTPDGWLPSLFTNSRVQKRLAMFNLYGKIKANIQWPFCNSLSLYIAFNKALIPEK